MSESIKNLILKNRSYRKFYEEEFIPHETLKELVDLARISPSAANIQPLKYIISSNSEVNELIFSTVEWANYIKNWSGPEEGERPSAYILILGDTAINKNFGVDYGIAAQSIMLGAVEKGLGGCMIGSIKRTFIREKLEISNQYQILLALALGKPKEDITLEDVTNNDIKYWRSEDGTHHVPKRSLDELIIKSY